MLQPKKRFYTPEEYLALEETAEYRSEYDQGEIFAMAGGSYNHSVIKGNTEAALRQALAKKPCEVHSSDLRLNVKRRGYYTYPDVMVICGKVEFVAGRTDTVTNPVLIVEVLSPSTREYDRVTKFARYKQLASLREYVLVDSEQVHVTLLRLEAGKWVIELYDELDQVVKLESVGCKIALQQLYDKVEFEQKT